MASNRAARRGQEKAEKGSGYEAGSCGVDVAAVRAPRRIALWSAAIGAGVFALLLAFFAGRISSKGGVPVGGRAAPPEESAPALARLDRQSTGVRLILVGFDSMDWQVADPLIRQGRMPNLRRMMERGCRIRLRSISPMLSPVLWTSIATGREPADHGILDFVAANREGQTIPVTARFRRVPAIWNLASAAGLKTGVVGWWATWPAEAINGYVVTDRLAYQLFGLGHAEGAKLDEGMISPASLEADISPWVVHKSAVGLDQVRRFLDLPQDWETSKAVTADDRERVDLFRGYISQAESYRRIGLEMHRRTKPDLDLVYFEAPDEVSHIFMCFRPPAMAGVDPLRVRWFGAAVDRYYEECDRILGEYAALADAEKAALVVCSDHGFRNGGDRPGTDSRIGKGGAADWHRKYGMMACAGGPFVSDGREIEEASVLDILPTLAAALGIPLSSELPGHVITEAFDPAFLKKFAPRSVASYGQAGGGASAAAAGGAPTAVDRDQIEALAALGYVDGQNAPPKASSTGETQSGPNYHNNRGSLAMKDGRWDEAITEFQQALQVQPKFYGARINLARAYRQKGDTRAARTELDRILAERGPDKSAYHEIAQIEMNAKNWQAADAALKKALEVDPNDIDVLNTQAELYEKSGRTEEAIAVNMRAIAADPEDEQAYNNIGNIWRARGNQLEAESWYRKAIRADSDYAGSFNNLGLALQDQGRYDEAEKTFETALEKYRKEGAARHELAVVVNSIGTLCYRRGEQDPSWIPKALARFQEAVQIDPNYAEAHNNVGAVSGMQGRRDEEMREYEAAVKLDPLYVDGWMNLARACNRSGQRDRALEAVRRVLALNPRHVGALTLQGVLFMNNGDSASALSSFDRALAADPRFLPALAQKEKTLTAMGRLPEALQTVESALALYPGEPTLIADLQALRQRLGRK